MTASTDSRRPTIFGTGLIALDLVMNANTETPVRSWAGGTCGNVLSILAFLGWDAFPVARMNDAPASQRVKADMKRWGVRLDFAACEPTTHTPIIIQEIRRGRDGLPTHRFSWSCPRCGHWLPSFKSVTAKSVEAIASRLSDARVFFMDRLSRAAILLAGRAAAAGAVVVFEPSGRSDERLVAEAIKIAHILKYADQRLASLTGAFGVGAATMLEVQTLGSHGLKFRHHLGRGVSAWEHLASVPAPRVADTCGSGDWCTSGLLARAAVGGQQGLRRGGVAEVREALRFGQALAAWNCAFEGARGGMYAVERAVFEAQIQDLLAGRLKLDVRKPTEDRRSRAMVACPACLPNSPRPAIRSAASRSDRFRRRALAT